MKLKISKKAEKIKPSATLAVSALAREMKSAGRPVLSFSAENAAGSGVRPGSLYRRGWRQACLIC
ncbi:MAG: hypothetical protein LBU13_09625 [Synergistaceae bacterium]|nr:hypothetical protein [Synergistaceae bacterium]